MGRSESLKFNENYKYVKRVRLRFTTDTFQLSIEKIDFEHLNQKSKLKTIIPDLLSRQTPEQTF